MLTVKKLNVEQVENVYKKIAINDFDKTELKPFKTICKQMAKEMYMCYAMFEEESLCAYAFFAKSENGLCMLLDYFAVSKQLRRKNYGSKFFELLKDALPNVTYIMAEVEDSNIFSSEEERIVKENREKFYLKNNFTKTDIKCKIFKHDYTLFCLNIGIDEMKVQRETLIFEFLAVYKDMLTTEIYNENILCDN